MSKYLKKKDIFAPFNRENTLNIDICTGHLN
jgi:hypothetical protein